MSVRSTITSQFQQVAVEQERALAPLSDDLKLVQSGLDSLSFAIIVARLEDALGIDPFNSAEALEFPGDLRRLRKAVRKLCQVTSARSGSRSTQGACRRAVCTALVP